MQNLTSTLGRFAVVLAGALAFSSCSRSDYAFLPKSASYLGTTTAAPKVRRSVAVVAAPAEAAQTPVVAPALGAEASAVAPEIVVATAPAPHVAPTQVAAPHVAAQATPTVSAAPDATVATAAPKSLNLVQRMALAKVTKKVNKLANQASFKQGDNTAHTARISGNLRTGLVLILIGLLISLLSGIAGIFGLIGGIIAIIGLIFIVLWLLDEL